ncbi:MAG: acyl carrier protein [Sphingomonadaceae bacterium]|nr:acyl carrier protein [Sphingomonadaceae bacterium]
MPANDLVATVRSIVAATLGAADPPAADARAREVAGWDSHATVQIIFAIEDHFGFEMTGEEMESIDSVASIVAIATRRTAMSMPARS